MNCTQHSTTQERGDKGNAPSTSKNVYFSAPEILYDIPPFAPLTVAIVWTYVTDRAWQEFEGFVDDKGREPGDPVLRLLYALAAGDEVPESDFTPNMQAAIWDYARRTCTRAPEHQWEGITPETFFAAMERTERSV